VAGAGGIALVWRTKLAEIIGAASTPSGAAFTLLGVQGK
jgi:heme exporter protein C